MRPSAALLFLISVDALVHLNSFVLSISPRQREVKGSFLTVSESVDPFNSMKSESFYSREYEEIEEMGGDPFFFTPPESGNDSSEIQERSMEGNIVDDEFATSSTFLSSSFLAVAADAAAPSITDIVEERYATDGKGPTPSKKKSPGFESGVFEWDGTVDEEAHFGLD